MAAAAKLVMAMAVVMAIVLSPSPACACSCVVTDDETYFSNAEAVFTGTVTEQHRSEELLDQDSLTVLVFRVSSVHKGNVTQVQGVRTFHESSACGLNAKIGMKYLVFASSHEGQLVVDRCGGTRVEGTPVALHKMEYSHPAPGESGMPNNVMWWSAMVVALAVATASAAVMWRHLRRRDVS